MTDPTHLPPARTRARPMRSLVAAARQVTGTKVDRRVRRTGTSDDGWQDRAWDAYAEVGELRYAAVHIARALSRAQLGAARDPAGAADPTMVDPSDESVALRPIDLSAADLVADLGGGSAGQSTLLQRLGVLLFVPGEAYIVGLSEDPDDPTAPMTWVVASPDELSVDRDGRVTLDHGDGRRSFEPDDLLVTRVWNPHPRRWWEPDSSTRSALPILREVIGLTAHIDASVESRLAGAGLLIVPNSVTWAGDADDADDGEDPFVDALMDAMLTPIKDRDSAAAVVPLVIRVPDEVAANGGVTHLSFSTPFDREAPDLLSDAIRRLALSLDVPPEVLTGMGDANHWSAWAISESTVVSHVEPMLAQVCDALTVGYLRPALEALGYPEADVDEMAVWFSTANLVLRPNRAGDAQQAHDRGVIGDDALREALGFGPMDAPPEEAGVDVAVQAVLDLVRAAPSLAQNPGMPNLLAQVRDLLAGRSGPSTEVVEAVDLEAVEDDDDDSSEAVGPPNIDESLAASLGLLPRR